jgi:hypothetical protein
VSSISLAEIALALALAWGAGIRVYLVLFLCGLAGRMGWIELPGSFALLAHSLVLGASGFMLAVEFFADKFPWIDSLWDAVHSFIRIPAGAALAAMVFGDGTATALPMVAAILGGAVAAGAHLTKAGTRGAINASPEPFSNWTASMFEDALVPIGLWLAVFHPVVFLVLLAAFAVTAILLIRWLIRVFRGLNSRLSAR